MTTLRYPRVLLKLSGEALAGDKGFGFDFESLRNFAREVKAISDMGVQVGMVIGGGNIVRGSQISKMGMDRVSGAGSGSRQRCKRARVEPDRRPAIMPRLAGSV